MSGLNTAGVTQVNPTNTPNGFNGAVAVTQADYPQAGGAAPQQLSIPLPYVDAMTPIALSASANTIVNTSGAANSLDAAQGRMFTYTLPANTTFPLPANMLPGQTIIMRLTQDGTGSRLATWNAGYKFAGGSKTLSTAAGAIDVVTVRYDGTTYLASLSTAFA